MFDTKQVFDLDILVSSNFFHFIRPFEKPTLWLSTLTSTMTLTLDFQGQILKSRIPGMGWPIDMEWKGCESIECDFQLWPHHDLGLGLSRWNIEIAVRNKRVDSLGMKGGQIDRPSNESMWNSYSFQPVGPWTGYSFTDLGAEGCRRSLNALLCLGHISCCHRTVTVRFCGIRLVKRDF